MKSTSITLIGCLSLALSASAIAGQSIQKKCEQAWKQNSAQESCINSQTVIKGAGNYCYIEAICLNSCTWQTLTDINNITPNQVQDLQNCNGQLEYSSAQCKIYDEGGCDD